MDKETRNLGVPQFLKGVTPERDPVTLGWYETGRDPHRADGRPSNVDFLPRGLITNQTNHEEVILMATTPATRTPGATLGNDSKPKNGPSTNLNTQTGVTPPKGNDSLR